MELRRGLMGLAGVAGVWLLAGGGTALAAAPRCGNITLDSLRHDCLDRAARCEPMKSAAERDECYRGRASKAADAPVATEGPLRLIPKAALPPPPPPPPPAPSPAPAPVPVPVAAPPAPPPPAPLPPPPAPAAAAVVRPGQPAAIPAPIPQPAPSADPAQSIKPPPPGNALETVRAFYAALAQADGARANGFLIPEKRNTGAYEIASMSRYYGNMREPVRLLAAEPAGPDALRVRYHYVYANGRVCDGAADIALTQRDGRTLIERIKALNGC